MCMGGWLLYYWTDPWKTGSWNSERVSSVFNFVCVRVSVGVSAGYSAHLGTYFFGWMILGTWHKKETHFLFFFEIFIFTLFMDIFRFFPYITLVIFCFQATGHNFSPRDMIFGLREPCTIGNWRLLTFFENSIFYG